MYGVEVSPALISDITDGVLEQARAWQNRPLEAFYPVVFLDALCVKMRHEGQVENRAVFIALAINLEGQKEVLGLWTGGGEGAKFWLGVLTELRNRGVRDIYLVCVDGPFAETKEQLAGYYILDCQDLDEALKWAAKIPTSCAGAAGYVEVRPIREIQGHKG